MKTVLSLASVSTALLVAGLVHATPPAPATSAAAAPLAATAPAASALPLSEVYQRLRAAGYRDVSELEHKRRYIQAEATDREGQRVELELDPASAAVRHSEREDDAWTGSPNALDLGQLLAKLEAAGYRGVREIELERHEVEVRATDAQGRRVKLHLDPHTGAQMTPQRH